MRSGNGTSDFLTKFMNVILYVNVSQLHEASESPSLIRCILTVTLHSGNGVVYLQGLIMLLTTCLHARTVSEGDGKGGEEKGRGRRKRG